MFSRILSASIVGIDAAPVTVETDVSEGLPQFQMVGLLSSEVREARDRVRTALRNSHYLFPPKHITVNLSPADLKKEGTAFDLPIAIGILCSLGILDEAVCSRYLIAGELGLNGSVTKIRGALPMACLALERGITSCIFPRTNAPEASMIEGVKIYGVESLREVVEFLLGVEPITPEPSFAYEKPSKKAIEPNLSQINGQRFARRALEIAAAGFHNVLLSGPPGSGKTLLAKAIPGIMPAMTFEESLEVSKIYGIAGALPSDEFFMTTRPFRDPHHTTTAIALSGGGSSARPGELSLASSGVLFLDELPEFARPTIEVLRQPLEERTITVTRLGRSYTYPASFMLVAAMNPCPCGHFPDRRRCTCTREQVAKYMSRISKPLLDRFDMRISVQPIKSSDIFSKKSNESSEIVRERVMKARLIQEERFRGTKIRFNSEIKNSAMESFCSLSDEGNRLLSQAFDRLGLSARGCSRIIKTARTIADLDASDSILSSHLEEAICYRGSEFSEEGDTFA